VIELGFLDGGVQTEYGRQRGGGGGGMKAAGGRELEEGSRMRATIMATTRSRSGQRERERMGSRRRRRRVPRAAATWP